LTTKGSVMTTITLSQLLRRIGSPTSVKNLEVKLLNNEMASVVGTVGAELATEITAMEKRFQRPLKPEHAKALQKAMEKDQFETSGSIVIGLVKQGETPLGDLPVNIQDGQHRLAALAGTSK